MPVTLDFRHRLCFRFTRVPAQTISAWTGARYTWTGTSSGGTVPRFFGGGTSGRAGDWRVR